MYAFDTPLQPGDVQAELLPQHMKTVLFQPPGSISRAGARTFRYKGVRLRHLHDAPAFQESLVFRFKGQRIHIGQTGHNLSLHGALMHDLMKQAAGQPLANFTSQELRIKVLEKIGVGSLAGLVRCQADQLSPEKRAEFLVVMRAAGDSDMILELKRWASLPQVDNAGNLYRSDKKRKLGDLNELSGVVPQMPDDAAAAPFAEPAADETAAPIISTATTSNPASSSSAAGAAGGSAGPGAMLGAAAGLLALSAAPLLDAAGIPQQLPDALSSSPGASSSSSSSSSSSNDHLMLLAGTASADAAEEDAAAAAGS
ncbi:hypothetical protein COO60DRAFT_1676860 [Scenedesmus sp. NREL 46B-D3]|nr:hypothetical protein COO60DRAFT_1676860 [Scenedesmus sp. NREL 46B-D3]